MSLTDKSKQLNVLWYFFRPHKWAMAVVLLTMILSSLMESLNLAAFYPIMNYGLKIPPSKNFALKFLDQTVAHFGPKDLFFSACLFLIVVTVFAVLCKVLEQFTVNKLILKIEREIQTKIYAKYLAADYNYFVRNQQGQLIYASTVAPRSVAFTLLYFTRIIQNLLTAFFFTCLLILLVWQFTIAVFVLGVFYFFVIRKLISRFVTRAAQVQVDEDRKKNVILNEFITGIKTIKVFHQLDYWTDKYQAAVNRSLNYKFQSMMGRIIPEGFLRLMFFIMFGIVGILLERKVSGNILPLVPMIGTFGMVISRLFPYINLLGNDFTGIAQCLPDIRIVHDLLEEKVQNPASGVKELSRFSRQIAFQNVSFRYPQVQEFLLKGISFTIEKNKVTAIVGPSGAGKTSIINVLLRLYPVNEGEVLIDGININELTLDSYLDKIGYIGQETFVFNGTVAENIRFGRKNVSEEELIEAAKQAYAHEFIVNLEKGYNTIVGDAGMKLSGGQRQRLAIARAMLRKPQILVLDEATSSLDNISERRVQEAINNVSQYTTVLVIAHRLSTVQNADKIIVLQNGKVMETGTHDDLLQKASTYASLYKGI